MSSTCASATGIADVSPLKTMDTSLPGRVIEFPLPSSSSDPGGIAAGPAGNLWFIEYKDSKIGRISTSGKVTEFPLPTTSDDVPGGISAGPDGNLWFTETEFDKTSNIIGSKIERISLGDQVTEFPLPGSHSSLEGITAGADGNLWFTESGTDNKKNISGSKIGRITFGK